VHIAQHLVGIHAHGPVRRLMIGGFFFPHTCLLRFLRIIWGVKSEKPRGGAVESEGLRLKPWMLTSCASAAAGASRGAYRLKISLDAREAAKPQPPRTVLHALWCQWLDGTVAFAGFS